MGLGIISLNTALGIAGITGGIIGYLIRGCMDRLFSPSKEELKNQEKKELGIK